MSAEDWVKAEYYSSFLSSHRWFTHEEVMTIIAQKLVMFMLRVRP